MKHGMLKIYGRWSRLWESKYPTDPFNLLILGAMIGLHGMGALLFAGQGNVPGLAVTVTGLVVSCAVAYELCKPLGREAAKKRKS
ncbi:hypothetical protein AB4Y45_32945 [Paraburkholderia sp. EG287A]|uniref:hypothetical protein n=1 Tax=Paraburkholderia sp. EG287A TaxID=3237012 RepID=UPI0034D1E683